MRVTVLGSGKLGLLIAQVLAKTGCKLDVVGRNTATLQSAEKMGIQPWEVAGLIPRHDRDVVVECTGSADGLDLAMQMVRPRGTIVLKTTHAGLGRTNLAPVVINEVTLLGSRCGPFPEAIQALARKDVDVTAMISRVFPLDQGLDALDAAKQPGQLKILLKMI